ncbi:hypothetical protein BDR03DRAFT_981269 [Suillus americanus]|nr:hypothetical protein BDR03DRAFT_981269 [Suillus americanus]
MNFTFINKFAPNDSEELVVDNPQPTKAANRPQIGREDKGDQVQAPNSKSKGAKVKKAKTGQGSCNKLASLNPMTRTINHSPCLSMLDAVQECTKGHTIFLYLLKPIDLEGPPEASTQSCCDVRYEYDEDSSVPPEHNVAMSHKAQIHQESTKEVMELECHYPIGSHPLFPNKRIYAKNSLFWELSSLRLDVWGAAIHQSTPSDPHATYDMPPVSNYLTKDKAIKPARPPPNSPMTMFAAYGAYAKGKDYTPESHGGSGLHTALIDYENSMLSRSRPDPSFFTHQLPHPPSPPSYYHPPYYPYQYSYYPLPNAIHPPTAPPHPPSAPLVPAPATGSVTDSYPSPGITTKHSVTLEAFCAKFVVSASDSEKLSKLGYNPGSRIVESLTMAD